MSCWATTTTRSTSWAAVTRHSTGRSRIRRPRSGHGTRPSRLRTLLAWWMRTTVRGTRGSRASAKRRGGPAVVPPPPGASPIAMADLVVRSLRLVIDFLSSLPADAPGAGGSIVFSTSPTPPAVYPRIPPHPLPPWSRVPRLIGLTLPLSWADRIVRLATRWTGTTDLQRALPSLVEPLRHSLRAAVRTNAAARRSYELVELVTANLVGVMVDGLLTNPDGFGAINHLDYREWLLGHGMDPASLGSPILRGMYDLVFGYEGGDPARPRFSAGVGLELATKMLLEYSGALFWKMQAGMGEVIFAPLFEVLRRRGVEFRFFHRVDALRLE